MILVVGAEGFLGNALVRVLKRNGEKYVHASHSEDRVGTVHIDLSKENNSVQNLKTKLFTGITHAVICSSITNIDRCYRELDKSRMFNMFNTVELLKIIIGCGIVPVFCSSDLVFAGDAGNYKENDVRLPTTEYGKQKKYVEDFLLQQGKEYLIVRLSKLYSLEKNDKSPVLQLVDSLQNNQVVQAANDQFLSPTYVFDAAEAIRLLINKNANGVYNVAVPEKVSRYDLAMLIAKRLNKMHLVKECSISNFSFLEPRPRDNSLNTEKFFKETKFKFSLLQDVLLRVLPEIE